MARRERQLRVQPNKNDSEVGGQSRAEKYAGSFKLRFLGFGSTFHKSGRRKPEELQGSDHGRRAGIKHVGHSSHVCQAFINCVLLAKFNPVTGFYALSTGCGHTNVIDTLISMLT